MTEQPRQLSIDDELEDFGDWMRALPPSPLTAAERDYLRAEVDRRRREQVAAPTDPRQRARDRRLFDSIRRADERRARDRRRRR